MSTTDTFEGWYDRIKSMVTGAVPGQQKGERLDSCVRQVMAQGHDRESAYAICNDTLKADLEKSERDELLDTAREMSKYDPQVPLTFGNLVDYAGVDVKGEDELELPKSCRRCNTKTRVAGSFMCPDCDPQYNREKGAYELVGSGVQEATGEGGEETEEKADGNAGSSTTRKVYLTPENMEDAPSDAVVKSDERGLYYETSPSTDVDQKAEKALPDNAVSIDSRDEAPEGARVVEGDRGGLYYIPEGEDAGDNDGGGNETAAAAVAEEMGLDKGDVDLDGLEPSIATGVAETLTAASDRGWTDNVEEVRTSIGENDPDEKADAVAAFSPTNNDLFLNPDIVTGENMESIKDSDHLTDPSLDGIVNHELGHARHAEMGLNDMNLRGSFEALPKLARESDAVPDTFDRDPEDLKSVAEEVSDQAAMAGTEFVAEVHAGKASGQEFSDNVEALYAAMGGPEVEQ